MRGLRTTNLVTSVPGDGADNNLKPDDGWTIDTDNDDSGLLGGTAYGICLKL